MASEWVEIVEPRTRVRLFANLCTGECRWDEPRGVVISRATNPRLTQWWELYDNNSQRFYYYCAKDSKTVWRRPTSPNAVVVPLAKLQILKQNTTSGSGGQPSPPAVCRTSSVATQTEPELCSRATQTQENENLCQNSMNSFRNPSLKHYLISEARLTHAMRARDLDLEYDSNEDFEDVLDSSDLSCDADDEYDCDLSEDDDDSEDDVDCRLNEEEEDDRRRPEDVTTREAKKINSLLTEVTQSGNSRETPTKSHSLSQISVSVDNTRQQLESVCSPRETRPQTPPTLGVNKSLSIAKPLNELSIESFAKENIERHRKRGLFIGKKVSLRQMLEWSRKSIRKPMISSISDQKLRNESKIMFKFVQKFMRDLSLDSITQNERQLTTADDTDVALYLLTTASQQPILRDELLVQIARQTTNNPSKDSELRGLRLMCACFWYFPPSAKLAPHLEAFVSQHSNAFAFVVKRKFEQQLRRQLSSHVVYVRKPHDKQEVERVLNAVNANHVGVFGEALESGLISGRRIAWPVVVLTEALLRDCDAEREGVFRCVGDLDEVARLKLFIDTSLAIEPLPPFDVHVMASALKLYFRELRDPLIHATLYSKATEASNDWSRAHSLLSRISGTHLPTLAYLVRFLQVLSAPEHVIRTRMDDSNLAMVFAPNLLRPFESADSSLAALFERTRAEMSFVRLLITRMDTSFIAGQL